MISRYGVFCRVVETGSFTKAAQELGYSQSAVSQTVKTLEQELGTVLLRRRKDGTALTADGEQYFPFLQAVSAAEQALAQKQREMAGLASSTVRIGTFTSVSRNLLPERMKAFKQQYPKVNFVLRQGEYTSIARWVRGGEVDFGFVDAEAVQGVHTAPLYCDEMVAVLPPSHPLSKKTAVSLRQLSKEPFILLDEGEYSVALAAFRAAGLHPCTEYEVYDDYSILVMVRQGLGVSAMYQRVVQGFEQGLAIRPIVERPRRTVALAWNEWNTMSLAARRFAEFLRSEAEAEQREEKRTEAMRPV